MSKIYKIFFIGLKSKADHSLFEKFLEEKLSIQDRGKRHQILYLTPSILLETENHETASSMASYLEQIGAKIEIKSVSPADTMLPNKEEVDTSLPKKPRRSLIKKIFLGVFISFVLLIGFCVSFYYMEIYPEIKIVDNIFSLAENGRLDEAWDRITVFVRDNKDSAFGLWTLKEIAIKQAREDFNNNRFKEAAAHIHSVLEHDENDPNLLGWVGVCYYHDNDITKAEDYLQKALDHGSNAATVHQTLSLIYYYHSDRADLALKHCQAALKINPGGEDIKQLLKRIKMDSGNEETFTSNCSYSNKFIIKYSGHMDVRTVDVVMHILEEAALTVNYYLGEHPTEPIVVVLYTDKEFRESVDVQSWTSGYFDGRIKLLVKGLPDKENMDLKRILYHEYTHVIFLRRARTYGPCWFNEGLAQYMEEASGAGLSSLCRIDILKREKELPLLETLNETFVRLSETEAAKAYATSYLAVKFMFDEYGLQNTSNILKEMGTGKDFFSAFRDNTGAEFKEFENRFRRNFRGE